MSQISDISNPWRDKLLGTKASFRGIIFHVETGNRASGRRVVNHEYPKRDSNYAEDMGRHARRFSFSGYLIYRVNPAPGMAPYVQQRVRLIQALEQDDAGELVHPMFTGEIGEGEPIMAMCERYSVIDSREKGGYTQFEMTFVEAGSPGNSVVQTDSAGKVLSTATSTEKTGSDLVNLTIDELQRSAVV